MAEKAPPKEMAKAEQETTEFNNEELDAEDCQAAGGSESSWGGWFTNTFVTAKEKSNEMFQYLRQDLSEFSDTVQEAGRDLKEKLKLEDTAKTAATSVGSKVNTLFEQMSTIFGVGPDDDDELIIMHSGRSVVDRVQTKIYSLALEDKVFLTDPEDVDEYEKWLLEFDLEEKHVEIAELITANPHLQLHYSQLVPDKVSHLVFWHRFYYQVQQILAAESRPSSAKVKSTGSDNTLEAERNSSDHGMVEISEEDQKRLLAEYEEEMKQGEDENGRASRRSSGTQLSSSSSSSFAFVTHDALTDEVKIE